MAIYFSHPSNIFDSRPNFSSLEDINISLFRNQKSILILRNCQRKLHQIPTTLPTTQWTNLAKLPHLGVQILLPH
ncbi:hypothetical protein CABS01_00275 [Colletotrichum abscissum]|uniref:uncharacterized protein n=1 Tax=Colletotrichum abscissum TaxID=1671311 RepID=UPI0027D69F41|nr:uncharacterized protein CABS01_00275 [Colletotrichum abscissum]KAK1525186.1 hypothetical protein CABS01_00275 [Colletotrichum abscissum]